MHPTAHQTIGRLWAEFDAGAHRMDAVTLRLPAPHA